MIRRHFETETTRLIATAVRNDQQVVVVYADLNGLKEANDSHDHFAGDALIKEYADRIQHVFRASDIPCRYGGDEFVIACPINPDQNVYEAAETIGQRFIEAATDRSVSYEDSQLYLGASIGISIVYKKGLNFRSQTYDDDLKARLLDAVKDGEAAMKAAKWQSKERMAQTGSKSSTFEVFDPKKEAAGEYAQAAARLGFIAKTAR